MAILLLSGLSLFVVIPNFLLYYFYLHFVLFYLHPQQSFVGSVRFFKNQVLLNLDSPVRVSGGERDTILKIRPSALQNVNSFLPTRLIDLL